MSGTELAAIGPTAVLAAVALCLHEVGRHRLAARTAGTGLPATPMPSRGQPWLFRGGVVLAVLILLPPIGRWGSTELFARALVDVTLAYAVAPLVLLGRPGPALAAALGRARPTRGQDATVAPTAAWEPAPGGRQEGRRLLGPVGSVAAFLGVVAVWHVPAVLDATAGSVPLWDLEMVTYLAAGLLLWSQLVGSRRAARSWGPLERLSLGVAVLVGVSLLGAAMLFSPTTWYPAFDGGRHALLPAAIDQGFAGATLGVVPAIPLGAFAWWCFTEWIRRDDDDEELYLSLLAAPDDAVAVAGAGRLPRLSMEERTR